MQGTAAFGVDPMWRLAPTTEGNMVRVAGREVVLPDRETLTVRAEAIEARYKLPARKWLRRVWPYRARDVEGDAAAGSA